jgi:hypothetical protein
MMIKASTALCALMLGPLAMAQDGSKGKKEKLLVDWWKAGIRLRVGTCPCMAK